MKRCPTCKSTYTDDSLRFCLQDGATLLSLRDESPTLNLMTAPDRRTDSPTEILYSAAEPTVQSPSPAQTVAASARPTVQEEEAAAQSLTPRKTSRIVGLTVIASLILLGLSGVGAWVLLKERGVGATKNTTSSNETDGSASVESSSPVPTPSETVNNNLQTSEPPKKAATRATPAATPKATPKATPPIASTSGKWFIILGSYPRAESNKANQRLNFIRERGYDARIVNSDDYPNLKGGLLIVVMGPFARNEAEGIKNKMRSVVPDAYAKSGW